jgi:outer membrane protein assembly factor BamE (lipoprotein component of BamABCDE complex)
MTPGAGARAATVAVACSLAFHAPRSHRPSLRPLAPRANPDFFSRNIAAMKTLPLRPLALLLLAMLLAGCSTIDTRIREKSAAFAALDAPTQDKIRLGRVEVGFTTDLVYIALGSPDERLTNTSAAGTDETWLYNSYRQDYLGTAHVGYRRYVVIDPKTRQPVVFYEPVYREIYQDRVEERIRIGFKAGLVATIEQVKR